MNIELNKKINPTPWLYLLTGLCVGFLSSFVGFVFPIPPLLLVFSISMTFTDLICNLGFVKLVCVSTQLTFLIAFIISALIGGIISLGIYFFLHRKVARKGKS